MLMRIIKINKTNDRCYRCVNINMKEKLMVLSCIFTIFSYEFKKKNRSIIHTMQ